MNVAKVLACVPDSHKKDIISDWAEKETSILHQTPIDQLQPSSFLAFNLDCWDTLNKKERQQSITTVLLADWACYAKPEDRAEYLRLHDIISTFPKGFRIWFCQTINKTYLPVGYTGWYPIARSIFEKALMRPGEITHRRELWPEISLSKGEKYLWVFNYSIIKQLRKSEQSKKMLQTYAADIQAVNPCGLAAAVISEESKSVARKLGMAYIGNMTHAGVSEEVWGVRFTSGI